MKFSTLGKRYLKNSPLRSTDIKMVCDCPAKFRDARLLEQGVKDTPTMQKGRAIHHFFLQEKTFKDNYFINSNHNSILKGERKQAEEEGKEIIKKTDYLEFFFMRDAYQSKEKPHGIDLYSKGVNYEKLLEWKEDIKGKKRACNARLDAYYKGKVYDEEKHIIIDLKTTSNAAEYDFIGKAYKLFYHVQVAHYIKGYSKVFNVSPSDIVFAIIAIESSRPYRHNIYITDGNSFYVEDGEEKRMQGIETLIECCEAGKFGEGKDYLPAAKELSFPYYAKD